jgi:hypothetical protein
MAIHRRLRTSRRYRRPGPAAALALLLCGAVGACEGRDGDRAAREARADGEAMAATPGFASQGTPYATRALEAFGRVTGSVEIDGSPPPDSIIRPTVDVPVCGAGFMRRGVERRGNLAVGVVVWIDGIRSGKTLPLERRFEITTDRCVVVPELQTAIAGGTLNVRSLDAVEHRTRIVRSESGEAVATIRETDEGQVVPNERVLARPGILEISCEVHPWTQAWIAAFDHPYFASTGADGRFVMDSVPPGRYQLRTWHPRLGTTVDSITIEAGREASVVLRARPGA